jgi:hypothetical protein
LQLAIAGARIQALELREPEVVIRYQTRTKIKTEIELGETVVVDMLDGTGKHFPAYYTPGSAWCGLQIGGAYDIVRIANLTADTGKGLTDDLIYTALSRFPGGRSPTHIVMNRRSLSQLRKSRTATNATGTPAPIPREVEGIPILVTEAISSTEALET